MPIHRRWYSLVARFRCSNTGLEIPGDGITHVAGVSFERSAASRGGAVIIGDSHA